ncbi:parafibromin [Trichinella spiralis]|uniref:parafibromin n=1 Tax=Trichinella spiralis TaxID=6334 RepID=UPI0001EFB753|nr:parafibromin [Trichinella spiralis]
MLLLTILIFACKQLISVDILVLGQAMGPDVSGLNDRDAMMVNLLYAAAVEANQAKSSSPMQMPSSNFDMTQHTATKVTQPLVHPSLVVPPLSTSRIGISKSKPSPTTTIRRIYTPAPATTRRVTYIEKTPGIPHSAIQQAGSSVSTMFYPVYSRNVQPVSSATWNPRIVQQVQFRKVRPMSNFVNIPAPPSLPSYRQQRGQVSENSRILSGLMSASDLPTPPPLPFQLDGDPSLFPTPPPTGFQSEATTRTAKLPPRNPFQQIVAKSPLWK